MRGWPLNDGKTRTEAKQGAGRNGSGNDNVGHGYGSMLHHPDHQGHARPPKHQTGHRGRHGNSQALARVWTTERRGESPQGHCPRVCAWGGGTVTDEIPEALHRLDRQLINISQLVEEEASAAPYASLLRVITASVLPDLTTLIPAVVILIQNSHCRRPRPGDRGPHHARDALPLPAQRREARA